MNYSVSFVQSLAEVFHQTIQTGGMQVLRTAKDISALLWCFPIHARYTGYKRFRADKQFVEQKLASPECQRDSVYPPAGPAPEVTGQRNKEKKHLLLL